jgi:hypothetical protein
LFDFDAAPSDAVDPLAPGLTWRVLGADLGFGSPDPEFFGVIAAAPEPGSLGLLLLGIAAVGAVRARHSSRM